MIPTTSDVAADVDVAESVTLTGVEPTVTDEPDGPDTVKVSVPPVKLVVEGSVRVYVTVPAVNVPDPEVATMVAVVLGEAVVPIVVIL
ncbi:MAG: hypothetical protein ACYC1I_12770 [Acidimicrobiales bacterium]